MPSRASILPLSNGSFEVVARPGAGPREFWCAAGDYTYGFLRVAAAQRIYVSRPRGPSTAAPGRIAVTFSLTPPQGVDLRDKVYFNFRKAGDSLVAGAAMQHCYDYDIVP